MKIYKQLLLLIACLVPCIFLFSACKDNKNPSEPKVTSLNLELINENYILDTSSQSDTTYGTINTTYGSLITLSADDFKLTAIYNDGSVKDLSKDEFEFTTNIPSIVTTPSGNYTLTFSYNDSLFLNVCLVVNKQDVSTENISWKYSSPLKYNGKEQTLTIQNLPNTLKVTYSGTTTAKYPGKYSATATISPIDPDNYSASKTIDINWEIVKADLKIIANDASITYGEHARNNGCTYEGFVKNENSSDLGGTLSYIFNYSTTSNAGTYKITPIGLTSDNYNITFVEGTLTVNKATADTSSINTTNVKLKQNSFEETNSPITIELSNFNLPAGVKFIGLSGDTTKTDVGEYTAIARYGCSNTTNYEYFEPIEISLSWSISASAQSTPATTLPADLEISILGITLNSEDLIDYANCFIALFDIIPSSDAVTNDYCSIIINSAENISAVDSQESVLTINGVSLAYFTFDNDLGDYTSKIVINYQESEFVIFVVFQDNTLDL